MQSKAKILIVDDQLGPRESIRVILKDRYAVAAVSGAAEAFKYMAESPVDLVVLDRIMPEMDGLTALKEIKKRHPETEIILLTAYAPLEIRQKALKLGAFGYIIKPFNKEELLDIVDRALKNQSASKRLIIKNRKGQ